MCVLNIARVGVAVFKVIIMTVICVVVKRMMTINVVIVAIMKNAAPLKYQLRSSKLAAPPTQAPAAPLSAVASAS